MRFNSRELSAIAQGTSGRFDREGLLLIKEKQEGLFRKGEVYVERLFRLRGNLLFYFKTRSVTSDVLGLFVLERCAVELDAKDEVPFSFVLVFEGEEKMIQLAALSEEDRDGWIESLHIASYECMKIQLESLREQLRARTGRDPIDHPYPPSIPPENYRQGKVDDSMLGCSEPIFEISLKCQDLIEDPTPPSSFATISLMTPPSQSWTPFKHTEVVEHSRNPAYMTTIAFNESNWPEGTSRIRIVVYDMKERVTNTVAQIGSVVFTFGELLSAKDFVLKLQLRSGDFVNSGVIQACAWEIGENASDKISSLLAAKDSIPKHPRGVSNRILKRSQIEESQLVNVIWKTYKFPTRHHTELSVHEYMAESQLTFKLPQQLLRLWVEEEKKRIEELQELGPLSSLWDNVRQEMLDYLMSSSTIFSQSIRYLSSYRGAPFKPSSKKTDKEVEFAPVNLHLHRMMVFDGDTEQGTAYDVTTVGSFSAHSHKFKHGGLRKILHQIAAVESNAASQMEGNEHRPIPSAIPLSEVCLKMEKIYQLLNHLAVLQEEVALQCSHVMASAESRDSKCMKSSLTQLSDLVRKLVQICESSLVRIGAQRYAQARQISSVGGDFSDPMGHLTEMTCQSVASTVSMQEEPWDLTRLNAEAALVCVLSKCEELETSDDGITDVWLHDIDPLLSKLRCCVQIMCKRARTSLSILTIEESSHKVVLLHLIKYRRDVVFSQALTAVASAVTNEIYKADSTFLFQAATLGILLQFEGLLSCHGDEAAMLDDMAIAIGDLANITFKVKAAESEEECLVPRVEGNRTGYLLVISVPAALFVRLPREIQSGHSMRCTPVFFNLGINEMASLAERIGDLTAQEEINLESFQRLDHYFEKFTDIIGESARVAGSASLPLGELMRHLHVSVMKKRVKNVELLHQAAEVCRRLNGVRFTSCRSAKDRTAMSVTLEMTQLLARHHQLERDTFQATLDCLRSEGVRRENTLKNVGVRKYHFNYLQLQCFPRQYKPPSGTYGNIQS